MTFTAPGSGASGTFGGSTTSTTVTNPSGDAQSATFTANSTVGTVTVNATVAGIGSPAAFTLNNVAGNAVSMTASPSGGTPPWTPINTAFSTAIGVLLKDLNAINLSGASVTFTVNSVGGAGATFSSGLTTATVASNASGIATAPALTANGTAGTYTVTVLGQRVAHFHADKSSPHRHFGHRRHATSHADYYQLRYSLQATVAVFALASQ